jgi:hypothetical protein
MFQALLEPPYSTVLTSIDTDAVLFSLSVTTRTPYKVLLICGPLPLNHPNPWTSKAQLLVTSKLEEIQTGNTLKL